jgi:hypothetical protein
MLNKSFYQCLLLSTLTILASALHAQTPPQLQTTVVETDWLKPEAGHEGKRFGARIEKVEKVAEKDITIISVALPENMKQDDIEEVVVLGKPDQIDATLVKLQQPKKFELYNSPEKNGIIVYLPKSQNFVLRINYFENTPDVEPDFTSDQN